MQAKNLISHWLQRQLTQDMFDFLMKQIDLVVSSNKPQSLYLLLGKISRNLTKTDLTLSKKDFAAANQIRTGWTPINWTILDAARILLLVELSSDNPSKFKTNFAQLINTADLNETVSFYRGLPLYFDQRDLISHAKHGIRSNVRVIFEAIAHYNPFPYEYFDTSSWNQMILKAIFVDSRLAPIIGIDNRCNEELSHMLIDYANERRSAHRNIAPELWRCVTPNDKNGSIDILQQMLASKNKIESQAAALTLCHNQSNRAQEILSQYPDLTQKIHAGEITWQNLLV